jgi:hypothetical protein
VWCWSCTKSFERGGASHDGLTLSRQLRGSILSPSPPWGTFTDVFAGAELIASRSAEDVSTLQQGTAPRLRAADSLTHSGAVTQEQDALLEVTSGASGDVKRRRVDASELLTTAGPLIEWQFDGGTTTLTHEEITIDTDMDGGVHMIAVVGSLTAEEVHGAPAVLRAFTESANIYLPRLDSPRGPHDWDEAMLTAYPVRIVQLLCFYFPFILRRPRVCSVCMRRRGELRTHGGVHRI